ncbi:hypothetical protein [Escherichia coli]|uniref:hypothetical protein n=1 Tax=Escherichia coli TaxID=562 RepID=UPI0020771A5F|nr:hypothetical protein [Escherichia coli]
MDLVFKVLASLGAVFYCIWHSYLGRESLFREISVAAKQNIAEFHSQVSATNERVKAKLDNSVYVTKAHFDKELSAYSLIWNSMFETRESVLKLRTALDHFDLNEPFEGESFFRCI